MIDVSILIPVYNVRDFVIRCLQSVVAQTYKGSIECIIVDDCGTDGSIDLINSFLLNYNGDITFQIIKHTHNRGLAAARNTALANAKGDFVFHLDSDDWLEPTAIDVLYKRQKDTGADIVSGNALKHMDIGNTLLEEPDYTCPLDMVHNTIEMSLDHVIWRRLIRKSLYTKNKIQAIEGVNLGEDHHTLPRLVYYAENISKVNSIVYHYNCLNQNSYVSKKKKGINVESYRSDIRSISILKNFFSDKDTYCVNRLIEIEKEYTKRNLFKCCLLGDKKSYQAISSDNKMKTPYFAYWLYVVFIRSKNKIVRLSLTNLMK